jgi:hypothetical protein
LRVACSLQSAAGMQRFLILAFIASCATAEAPRPDAAPPPIDPSGTYVLRSELHLATPLSGPVATILGDVRGATDAPDDPSRYLIDRMIAELPAGNVQTVAQALAPYLAAYVQARLSDVAPRLVPGIHAVSDQLASFSQQLDTIEAIRITPDRNAVVVLTGLRFGKLDVPLATGGISEPAVGARVTFAGGELEIEDHRLALPYSRLVRLALDRGIIPAVDPAAYDLPTLLADLVDCDHLGQVVAEGAGTGFGSVYAVACTTALRAVASEWYEHLDALDGMTIDLAMHGDARGVDLDRDGHMDAIANGIWSGTIGPLGAEVSIGGSTFEGQRQ